jgi:VIT1/CCC1 family predicted Fe2+/Mn2+ transporter
MPREERTLVQVAEIGLTDEYTDSQIYERLSRRTKNASFAEGLRELAAAENRHYEFWHKYAPESKPEVSKLKIYWILFLKTIFGVTFTVRYLERHEGDVINAYKSVRHMIPEGDMKAFDEMLADEEGHESTLSKRIEGSTIRYISFIVLGLADALVEVTGIHAGSLGIYNKTELAGLAGIIAGAAASLAMASAAYAQAKQGFQGSAKASAVYTGISYFVTAVILATPYFLTGNMVNALASSLTLAVVIITFTTYYSSVISNKPFMRDFLEILGIMFGVTAALYVFGFIIRLTTGIGV